MMRSGSINGITVALATPLHSNGSFDVDGMDRLVEYTLSSGVSCLFTLGVAGEVSTFDRDTRKQIIRTVKLAAGGRVPLIAGVFDSGTELVLRNIRDAGELGADCVLTTPPNFYSLTQDEMKDFFIEIADKGGMPVIIYNCSWTKNHVLPETIAELAGHPNIVALKETSDMVRLQQMHEVLKDREDFTLISGEEYLFLPALAIGIRAFMMGGPGNILPKQCIEIINDFKGLRLEEAARKYNNMFSFLSRLYTMRILDMAAVKAVLELSSICGRTVSKPFRTPTDQEVAEVAELIKRYNISL
jgi:dihydrodipicolinate synthase/N-acetylneuraminate lyase